MDGICREHGVDEIYNKTVTEHLTGRGQWEDLHMDAKIILKYIFKKNKI
jgi:hypothetical protein